MHVSASGERMQYENASFDRRLPHALNWRHLACDQTHAYAYTNGHTHTHTHTHTQYACTHVVHVRACVSS